MIPESLSPIANHLWQSTLFACAAWLLALTLRKNSARVRHWVWVAAALKFMMPFSLLIALGSQVPWLAAKAPAPASVSTALDQVSQPFAPPAISPLTGVAPAARISVIPEIIWTLWVCGFLGVGATWLLRWRRVMAAVRAGTPMMKVEVPIVAISSPAFIEPGIFGVFRPVLLLPERISEHLTPEQWKAVIEHELCHVRRRDNLVGLMQMFVETVFWFHPMTWWIGKQIVQEREQACDEEVVKLGNQPHVYARSILRICEFYLESPMPCVSGVAGSNLRKRVEAILNGRIAKKLNSGTKALLAAAGVFAVAGPIAIGLLHGVTLRAQAVSPDLRFDVASVRLAPPHDGRGLSLRSSGIPGPGNTDLGRFSAELDLINLILTAYDIPLYRVTLPQDTTQDQQFDIEAKMPADTTRDQFHVMLQNLLAERLGLKVHWITKDIDTYVLTVAKGGSKLKPAAPDPPQASDDSKKGGPLPNRMGEDGYPIPPPGNGPWMGGGTNGKMGMRQHNQTAEELAHYIGQRTLDGPLADATGLTGKYDWTILWSRPATNAAMGFNPAADPGDGVSIFDAVQEQLGLKIEKKKLPAQMLVVDHVEKKPTEN